MSDFFEMIEKRESCRNFSEKPVEKEKLIHCIEAARLAPSACNSQPWLFTVINNRELSPRVAKCLQDIGMNKFTDQCPAFIVVQENKAKLSARLGGKVRDQQYAQIDIGIAAAHICYAALEQGLSTCILGWFNEKKLMETLELVKNKRVRLVIAIGYAADTNLRNKVRKDLDDILVYKA